VASVKDVYYELQMHDGDELQDVVKYLELEQQFSTKRSSICTTNVHQ